MSESSLSPAQAPYRVAADIGGTFTDIAFLGEDGVVATKKVLSTPDDYAAALVEGVVQLMADLGLPLDTLGDVEGGFGIDCAATARRRQAKNKETVRWLPT